MAADITKFEGDYKFLSNFWVNPTGEGVEYDGIVYPTVEHGFQALKSKTPEHRMIVARARTAREAKILGRSVPLREDWEQVKDGIMERLLRSKFKPERGLQTWLGRRLADTGEVDLVEGNTWGDMIWGAVAVLQDPTAGTVWAGENRLGKLLMKIRGELIRNALLAEVEGQLTE